VAARQGVMKDVDAPTTRGGPPDCEPFVVWGPIPGAAAAPEGWLTLTPTTALRAIAFNDPCR